MIKKITILLVALLTVSSCADKAPSFDDDELIGVWSGVLFQTEAKFMSLTLSPAADPTQAVLKYSDGAQKSFELNKKGNYLSFKGSGGLRFDGRFVIENTSLTGVLTHDLWARSLMFTASKNGWISKVPKAEIIDTDYQVYLEFYRNQAGKIAARIKSNKENRKLHYTITQVEINGNDINFDITNGRFYMAAEYHTGKATLSFAYGNLLHRRNIILTKLSKNTYAGMKPRPNDDKYTYKIPAAERGIMPTASLDSVGIEGSLTKLMDVMNNEKYTQIHSILITRHGKLVFEEYFHGTDREYLHDIRSSMKPISALMVGKVLEGNSAAGVHSKILVFYPEYNITNILKKKITLHHALTMTSGLENEDEDKMQRDNADWVKYKLDHKMEAAPGEKYVYSDGGINLLSGVIEQLSGQYLPQYMQEKILAPLEIKKFQMLTSPKGRGYLPGNFHLRPVDFSKFGLLFLKGGKWKDQQVISKNWMVQMTTNHMLGAGAMAKPHSYPAKLFKRSIGGKEYGSIEFWGNGGQFLIIIPELELTITFTGGNYNVYPEMEVGPFDLLDNYIFPAIK